MHRAGQTYYYHQDSLGSVSYITDPAGNVVEKYDYDPFGQATIRDSADVIIPSSAISNPFMFAGRRLDPETGLYYYRQRYYDPGLGRFISQDPIGNWTDGINLGNGLAYVGNNPVNNTDPNGESIFSWIGKQIQKGWEKLKGKAKKAVEEAPKKAVEKATKKVIEKIAPETPPETAKTIAKAVAEEIFKEKPPEEPPLVPSGPVEQPEKPSEYPKPSIKFEWGLGYDKYELGKVPFPHDDHGFRIYVGWSIRF
jgi:RHS repeat-associated protein